MAVGTKRGIQEKRELEHQETPSLWQNDNQLGDMWPISGNFSLGKSKKIFFNIRNGIQDGLKCWDGEEHVSWKD